MRVSLTLAFGLIALLYASIGHAGATGYVALMALYELDTDSIRPTALCLNIIVASITTIQFWRAGHFRINFFFPIAVISIPAATLGGAIKLPTNAFESLVGIVLIISAYVVLPIAVNHSQKLTGLLGIQPEYWRRRPQLAAIGGGLGFLSGLTGVGGGVFLTPTLLSFQQFPVKQVAALSAPFILLNSVAGLMGGWLVGNAAPNINIPIITAVVLGGIIGSQTGAFIISPRMLRYFTSAVLVVAGSKLLIQGVLL